jgi:uncharacterized damage-inducible protein DinB
MKEYLLTAAQYNIWANDRFIKVLTSLDDGVLDKEIISSFSSIRKTVLHIWGAEDIWLQRLHRVEKPAWKAIGFEGTIGELCHQWVKSSHGLAALVSSSDDSGLTQRMASVSMKGERHEDAVGAALQHVFNHTTYHRGQLVTMLRQAGITDIPGTDLIAFVRVNDQ